MSTNVLDELLKLQLDFVKLFARDYWAQKEHGGVTSYDEFVARLRGKQLTQFGRIAEGMSKILEEHRNPLRSSGRVGFGAILRDFYDYCVDRAHREAERRLQSGLEDKANVQVPQGTVGHLVSGGSITISPHLQIGQGYPAPYQASPTLHAYGT